MVVTTSTTVSDYLFKGWHADGGAAFFGLICFTVFLCICAEVASHLMITVKEAEGPAGDSTLKAFGVVLFMVLRSVNYLQMLVVMTYNFWLILTLAIATGVFTFLSSIRKDKALLLKLTKRTSDGLTSRLTSD